MKQPQRIPTIIALFILIIGLGSIVFLLEKTQSVLTRAEGSTTPQQIMITNITDTSFTVSWITERQTHGSISYAEKNGKKLSAFDDRGTTDHHKYKTHHITARNLSPDTVYQFSIVSNDTIAATNKKLYEVRTAVNLPHLPQTLPPIYGTVRNANDQPASGTLIYFSSSTSQTNSVITADNGQFVLPVSPLRTQNLNQFVPITNNSAIEIVMHGENNKTTHIITTIKNAMPLPMVVLGKLYDFQKLEGRQQTPIATIYQNMERFARLFFPGTVYAAGSISITQPKENAGIPSQAPLFKGTGIANKQVIATVGNPVQTGKIWVEKNGTWDWKPSKPLSPGTHILTITTFDENNKAVALSTQFTILKSGASVLQAATPSATLTPTIAPSLSTPTPTPLSTLAPSLTPTTIPIASSSSNPPPVSGSFGPTIIIIGLGLLLVMTGGFVLL